MTPLLDQIRANDGATTIAFRQKLALTAYSRTAAYDTAVSTWLAGEISDPTPRYRSFAGKLAQPLRYGENPHQAGLLHRRLAAAPALPRRASGRARSCPTTTSTTPTQPSNWWPSLTVRSGLRDHQACQPLRRGSAAGP
jgi:hypothetical protein